MVTLAVPSPTRAAAESVQDWESLFTVSSVPSTVWGPGTVAGRALMALGEATLKGFERVIDLESLAIQRRLRTIRRQIPILTAEMYHDLMELARPELYPARILMTSLHLICLQINHGYSAAIAGTLSPLPPSEIRVILFQLWVISVTFDPEVLSLSQKQLPPTTWRPDDILNVLTVLVQLRSETAWVCYDVIDDLSSSPFFGTLFLRRRDHPILRMHGEESLNIPLICRTPLAKMQWGNRWMNWRLLEDQPGSSATLRLQRLSVSLTTAAATKSYSNPEFFDAAVDLFEILRYTKSPKLRPVAKKFLVDFLSSSNRAVWNALRQALEFTLLLDRLHPARPLALNAIFGKAVYVAVHLEADLSPFSTSSDGEPILSEFLCYLEEKNGS